MNSEWWIKSRKDLNSLPFRPLVLGLLDFSGILLSPTDAEDILHRFKQTTILRLITGNGTNYKLLSSLLPNCFVIDGIFLLKHDIKTLLFLQNENNNPSHHDHDFTYITNTNPRAIQLLLALGQLPVDEMKSNCYKLDMIFDDYLSEALEYNLNKLHKKKMPFVDVNILLNMPHEKQLDLSILLTISVIFTIPSVIFKETLLLQFGVFFTSDQISDLIDLPSFGKSAVVSILRRTVAIEREELRILGKLRKKPVQYTGLSPFDYSFHSLQPFFDYLLAPILSSFSYNNKELIDTDDFSAVEHDLLDILPDIPTLSLFKTTVTENISEVGGAYQSWIAVAARHAILLLMKSSTCPSLVQQQYSLFDQKNYNQLLPILEYAALTYEDMNISFHSGRILPPNVNTVDYGSGLPLGSVNDLTWNHGLSSSAVRTLPKGSVTNAHVSGKLRMKYRNSKHGYSARAIPTTAVEIPYIRTVEPRQRGRGYRVKESMRYSQLLRNEDYLASIDLDRKSRLPVMSGVECMPQDPQDVCNVVSVLMDPLATAYGRTGFKLASPRQELQARSPCQPLDMRVPYVTIDHNNYTSDHIMNISTNPASPSIPPLSGRRRYKVGTFDTFRRKFLPPLVAASSGDQQQQQADRLRDLRERQMLMWKEMGSLRNTLRFAGDKYRSTYEDLLAEPSTPTTKTENNEQQQALEYIFLTETKQEDGETQDGDDLEGGTREKNDEEEEWSNEVVPVPDNLTSDLSLNDDDSSTLASVMSRSIHVSMTPMKYDVQPIKTSKRNKYGRLEDLNSKLLQSPVCSGYERRSRWFPVHQNVSYTVKPNTVANSSQGLPYKSTTLSSSRDKMTSRTITIAFPQGLTKLV